ncbi:hypothetical protein J6590_026283 [Homalodisca vitripennis]|nr:hypothetical protein J6590_026283 [Homalodisca vitripennis]
MVFSSKISNTAGFILTPKSCKINKPSISTARPWNWMFGREITGGKGKAIEQTQGIRQHASLAVTNHVDHCYLHHRLRYN